jgi:chloride channel protein, CIC family
MMPAQRPRPNPRKHPQSESPHLADGLAAEALARSPHGVLPVLAGDGTYLGTATARSAAETLADGNHRDSTVTVATRLPAAVTEAAEL